MQQLLERRHYRIAGVDAIGAHEWMQVWVARAVRALESPSPQAGRDAAMAAMAAGHWARHVLYGWRAPCRCWPL